MIRPINLKLLNYLLPILYILSCNNTNRTDCYNGIKFNEIVYLNNPEMINLQVTGGYKIINLRGRSILLINQAGRFKAFDLQSPNTCKEHMNYDGLKIICPCTKKEYNSLNGFPLDNKGCSVLEYTTIKNGEILQLTR